MKNLTDFLPTGQRNAIPARSLCELCGFESVRQLQQHIEHFRNTGQVICSTCQDGGGYFLHEDAHELRAFIKTVENRAYNSLKSLESAKNALAELEAG